MGWAGSVTGGKDFPFVTRPTWFACARRDVMTLDRKYLVWAMGYAAVGMCLGIFMAATHDSEQIEAHSHTLLIGFVFSLGYGVIHKLWLAKPRQAIAGIQYIFHQAGALTMAVGLFLLYGDMLSDALLEPILGIASFAVLGGAVLMAYLIIKEDAVKT